MSTKIYNAFKFNGNGEELIVILKEIKKEYIQLTKNMLMKCNFSSADWILKKDRYPFLPSDLTWKELKEINFSEFILENIIRKEEKIGEHHPFNISASAVVYFCENNIYIQLFGLPRDYQKQVLNKYSQFKDYHYQNNTDQSNYDWDKEDWNIMAEERQKELEKEWDERKRIWNIIMPDYKAPSELGLSFDFVPINYEMTVFCCDILESIKI